MKYKSRIERILVQAFKIALGSSIAMYIATILGLQFATSAGIITLLTIVTTKWETLKLSLFRLLTFFISVAFAWLCFNHIPSQWIAFGMYLLLCVILCEGMGWRVTLSVNAVIGTHFMSTHDFSLNFITNEFLLVIIGVVIAILLNLVNNNSSLHSKLMHNMKYTENHFQTIFSELGDYLAEKKTDANVWIDLNQLEEHLTLFVEQAYEYQNNTFRSHPGYYIHYFEMRKEQCNTLHNLHSQIRKIRSFPIQAHIVAEYLDYLSIHIHEMNLPEAQIEKLHILWENIKQQELPKTHEEFESRAVLYHVLMDLEEFLLYKKHFIESLDHVHFEIYWDGTERK
ncbi:MAG: aromatic acid exporter family protein [Lachnospira sp.]|nr:aromatic acid exporter family protein [Lachnospira sp.]